MVTLGYTIVRYSRPNIHSQHILAWTLIMTTDLIPRAMRTYLIVIYVISTISIIRYRPPLSTSGRVNWASTFVSKSIEFPRVIWKFVGSRQWVFCEEQILNPKVILWKSKILFFSYCLCIQYLYTVSVGTWW